MRSNIDQSLFEYRFANWDHNFPLFFRGYPHVLLHVRDGDSPGPLRTSGLWPCPEVAAFIGDRLRRPELQRVAPRAMDITFARSQTAPPFDLLIYEGDRARIYTPYAIGTGQHRATIKEVDLIQHGSLIGP